MYIYIYKHTNITNIIITKIIYSHRTCVRTIANTFQVFAHRSVECRARGAISCMRACEQQEGGFRREQQEGFLRREQYIYTNK